MNQLFENSIPTEDLKNIKCYVYNVPRTLSILAYLKASWLLENIRLQ